MHMELNYATTADDLQELLHFTATQPNAKKQTQPSFSRTTWILVFILAAILGLFGLFHGILADVATRGLGAALLSILPTALMILLPTGWILLRRLLLKSSANQTLKAFPEVAVPRRALLTDEGVTIETATTSLTMIWKHFPRIVELKSSFALMDTSNAATLLPKRAFASPEQLGEFRHFIQTRTTDSPAGFPIQPQSQ
ncbi:MAG TPA: YcxB family protein [Phycisphaerae bacterium]|nr:YcxB family protein [Phycisphaerae bacterium]